MFHMPLISTLRRLRRPRALAFFLATVLILWGAWQAWLVSFDRPLQSTDVATREVRIEQAKLEAVTARLETYSAPRPPVAEPRDIFVVPDTGLEPSGG